MLALGTKDTDSYYEGYHSEHAMHLSNENK